MAYQTLCKQRYLGEGETVPFQLDGREIIVMWPDGGEPHAYKAVCPHDKQSLVNNSDFNGRILICTVHGWVFDGRNGKGLDPEGCKLDEYPLRVVDGQVEIDLDAEF
jgi:toluene monooxygenase system ferredoxin subunit